MPPTLQNGTITGHQRANTTNSKLSNKLDHNSQQTLVNRPTPNNTTNPKLSNKPDRNGQQTSVNRPTPNKLTEEPQEHIHHKEILSVQINDTQKSTYNAKVSNTEATALFDSGMMLSLALQPHSSIRTINGN